MKVKKMIAMVMAVVVAGSSVILTPTIAKASETEVSVSKDATVITNLYFAKSVYTANISADGEQFTIKALIGHNVENIASGLVEEAVSKISWAGSNPFELDVPNKIEKVSYRDDGLVEVELCLTCHQAGTYTIIGTTAEGMTARCTLTVKMGESGGEGGSGSESGSGSEGGSGNENDFDSDDIATITRTKEVEDESYGVTTYVKSTEGKIQEKARKLEQAMNQYIKAVEEEAESDRDSMEEGKNTAEKLREADDATNDRIITMPSGTPNAVMNSVYETLAMYLDTYVDKGVDLGKIDLKKSTIEISASLVNKISNSLETEPFSRKVGQYTVRFDITRMWDAYTGSVTVYGKGGPYNGSINSTSKKTAKIMNEYINELSDMVKDLDKKALMSIISELGDVSGISEYAKNEWNALLKDEIEYLKGNGYGDVVKNILKLRDDYDIVKDLLNKTKAGDLEASFKDAKKLYESLKNGGSYSDETVTKKLVSDAMSASTKAKNDLVDALYDYIYDPDNYEKTFWEVWKEKHKDFWLFSSQCPVDVIVYDGNGNKIGYAGDNTADYSGDIYIDVSGDVKNVYIPKDTAGRLELTATDDGVMNYVMEEVADGKKTGRMNYYDVPLEKGKGYSQDIPTSDMAGNTSSYPLKSDGNSSINASEYIASGKNAVVTVNYTADAGGMVLGDKLYAKGSSVELTAYAVDDAYEFTGWYVNDILVEMMNTYRFTARENVKVHAGFQRRLVKDNRYEVVLGEDYEEFACVDIYKNDSGTNDIALRMAGADESAGSYTSVTVKKYLEDGVLADSNILHTESGNMFSFWLGNINLDGCAETFVYDSSGKLIFRIGAVYTATFTPDKEGSSEGEVYFNDIIEGMFECTIKQSAKILSLSSYIGNSKTLEIPGLAKVNGEIYHVELSNKYVSWLRLWDSSLESIKFVIVADKKVSCGLNSLEGMFRNSRITTLDLRGLDTSNVTDMGSMFYGCSGLTSLDVSNLDTSNVTNMGGIFSGGVGMFEGCSSLTSLDISNLDTSNVTNMCNMFSGCSGLTSLDVSNLDTSNVTDMGSMFSGCSSLKSLNMSGWNANKVGHLYRIFLGCSSLVNLDMSRSDFGNVTPLYHAASLDELFTDCSSLKNVNMSGTNFGSLTDMSYMFSGLDNLVCVNMSKANLGNVTNMAYMFMGCNSLIDVNMDDCDMCSVTDMMCMFKGCSNLSDINMSSCKMGNVIRTTQMFDGCSSLQNVDIRGSDMSSVTQMNYMFCNCSSLTNIDFVGSWDIGGVTSANTAGMFDNCIGIISINLSEWNMNSVTSMEGMFRNCTNLKSVDMSSWNMSGAASMNGMFEGCENLASVNMREAKLENVVSINWMFRSCSNLKNVNMSGIDLGSASSANELFARCSNLEDIDMSGADFGSLTYGLWFTDCCNLINVNMNGVNLKSLTSAWAMFENCKNLVCVDMGDVNLESATSIDDMFNGCSNLTSVDMGGCNMSCVSIASAVFRDCLQLDHIVSPKGIGTFISLPYSFCDETGNDFDKIDNTVQNATLLRRKYLISYELNHGLIVDNPNSYTSVMETFDLKNPTRDGYTFLGWTGSNGDEPQTVVTIEKGTTGDLTYTANWKNDYSEEGGNTEDHTHTYNSGWEYDEDKHWKECDCGERSETASHTFRWKTDKAATMTEAGLKHEECTECGYTRNENTVIEKLDENHVHEYGTSYLWDETGHWQECECGNHTETEVHNFAWVIDRVSTMTENGLKHEECSICGYMRNEDTVIDKIDEDNTENGGNSSGGHIHSYNSGWGYDAKEHWKECSCGEKSQIASHVYITTVTKAEPGKDGSIVKKCSVCGSVAGTTTINCPKEVDLSKTAYAYTGKSLKPKVTVKDSNGKPIPSSGYSIKYINNKNVGIATVQISFEGDYSGSISKIFTINPKGTSITKIAAKPKGFALKWKKQSSQTTGYEIAYSTSRKFAKKDTKTATVKKSKITSKSVSKLKAKKKYYVRVRAYRIVKFNGKNVKLYSDWSKVKTVKTKK